jgi:hypothetical protein
VQTPASHHSGQSSTSGATVAGQSAGVPGQSAAIESRNAAENICSAVPDANPDVGSPP